MTTPIQSSQPSESVLPGKSVFCTFDPNYFSDIIDNKRTNQKPVFKTILKNPTFILNRSCSDPKKSCFPTLFPPQNRALDVPQTLSAILNLLVEVRWPKPRVAVPAIRGDALQGVHRRNWCERSLARGWRLRAKSRLLSSLNPGNRAKGWSAIGIVNRTPNPHSPRYAHHRN